MPDEVLFRNEFGWQDPITVTVKYHLALLPGPGRLLARYVAGPGGAADRVAQAISNQRQFLHLSADGLDYDGQRGREIVDSLCVSKQ